MNTHTCRDVLAILAEKKNIRITAHERPDGDAVGSCLALLRILVNAGFSAHILGQGDIPPRYRPFVESGEWQSFDSAECTAADAQIILDCGAFDRVGADDRFRLADVPVINIDHHDSNSLFGDINWVDPAVSCTGEMIWQLAKAGGMAVDRKAAEALWVALVTDTGRFSYENTHPGALRMGADLLDLGVDPAAVAKQIYQSTPLKELHLMRRALDRLQLHFAGRVASVCLTETDFAELDCSPGNAQDIVDIPRAIAGVDIGLFFYELPGEGITKVSCRSVAPYDVADLCRSFGGGGHRRAAGCSLALPATEAMETVLRKVQEDWFC